MTTMVQGVVNEIVNCYYNENVDGLERLDWYIQTKPHWGKNTFIFFINFLKMHIHLEINKYGQLNIVIIDNTGMEYNCSL